jgi:release factor glutamine methyltransferase
MILRLPGVFRPRDDSWRLAAFVGAEPLPRDARILDVCTGSGVVAVAAARRPDAPEVWAVDVSRRAVLTATVNARLNGTRVHARRGDLLAPVQGRTFDLIASNPPYLPGSAAPPAQGAARAWEGGPDGRAVLDRLLAEAPPVLAPGGVLLVTHSSLSGEEATLDALAAAGLETEVRARVRGELGELLSARARELRARGLLTGPRDEEEVLVIAGRRPPADRRGEPVAVSSGVAG